MAQITLLPFVPSSSRTALQAPLIINPPGEMVSSFCIVFRDKKKAGSIFGSSQAYTALGFMKGRLYLLEDQKKNNTKKIPHFSQMLIGAAQKTSKCADSQGEMKDSRHTVRVRGEIKPFLITRTGEGFPAHLTCLGASAILFGRFYQQGKKEVHVYLIGPQRGWTTA